MVIHRNVDPGTAVDARHPLLAEGIRLFNAEEFFEAHEVIEDLWQEFRGAERDLLKGVIQAAVALEHHRRGNHRGFRSVVSTASGYLRVHSPDGGGLDVAGLVRDLDAFGAAVERGESPPYPRLLLRGTTPPRGAEGEPR